MVLGSLKRYGSLVMFSHSLFSLPFGLIAMLWAQDGVPGLSTLFWILLALLGARNGANAFNRIADRRIDRKNPRTAERALSTGAVSLTEAWWITIFCFAVMAISAWMLNPLCLILLPFAIALFLFYSYTKRITWLCHFILGIACGGAPVGAWVAVRGSIGIVPMVMGAAVCMWVGGFDIIYATQDIEFDRQEHLHSIPARFGLKGALWIARGAHVMTVVFLMALIPLMKTGAFYVIGTILAALLLRTQHRNVMPENRSRMVFATYNVNQLLSVVFFAFTLLDFFVRIPLPVSF